jgi:late competence protein required for DNA uptake (superfamily II DNA/RNA helicase)
MIILVVVSPKEPEQVQPQSLVMGSLDSFKLARFCQQNATHSHSDVVYLGSLDSVATNMIDHISFVAQGAWTIIAAVTGYGKLRFIYTGKILSAKMFATATVAVFT